MNVPLDGAFENESGVHTDGEHEDKTGEELKQHGDVIADFDGIIDATPMGITDFDVTTDTTAQGKTSDG